MKAVVLSLVMAALMSPLAADETGSVRSLLRKINESARSVQSHSFRDLFTSDADYRDGTVGPARRAADSVARLFRDESVWSERTRPALGHSIIRLIGTDVALVDAVLVQYSSALGKTGVPVTIVAQKESGVWKVSAWRTAAATSFAFPVLPDTPDVPPGRVCEPGPCPP